MAKHILQAKTKTKQKKTVLQVLEGETRKIRHHRFGHRSQVYGDKGTKAECEVETAHQVLFLPCSSSILASYLELTGNLLHEDRVVTAVLLGPLAKPANDLPIPLTEEQEFLFMALTEVYLLPLLGAHLNLSESLHYVGHVPVRP